MKQWISWVLCLVLLLGVIPFSVSAETIFNGNMDDATALFLISGTNKAGQEFVPGFTDMKGIKVGLENTETNNRVEISLFKGSAADDSAVALHSQTFDLPANGKTWYEFTFTAPITLVSDQMYSIVLHSEKRAVWNGSVGATGNCRALNYDVNAYSGWIKGNTTAFVVLPVLEDGPEPYLAVQELINALPETITLEQEAAVTAARTAYDGLLVEQKSKITNLKKLTNAEATIAALKEYAADAVYRDLDAAIDALIPVSIHSREAIINAVETLNTLMYENGTECVSKLENVDLLKQAIADFNALNLSDNGDVTNDKSVDATDALWVLQNAVDKRELDQEQARRADVNLDNVIDATDALLILQYAVRKIDRFPADDLTIEPIEAEFTVYSKKNEELFANTYASMIERTKEDGYAQTSITGAYPGMFGRDSSIQVMAHVAAGDYDHAAKIMTYILEYHEKYHSDFVLHIMDHNSNPISNKLQVDTTFFFLHAWYLYATMATESQAKAEFLAASEPQIIKFADYFLDDFYFHENNLLLNPSLEHSRDGRYWYSYDLLTNTYASQGWHEMSLYFAQKNPEKAKVWGEAADRVAKGVHEHLVSEIDGKKYYAELIDAEVNNQLIQGFSWVNLAPMGCDWYAADPELLENTYQLYLQYGSCKYYRKYQMLDVFTNFNGKPIVRGNHVIGKGLAWEMMYCKKMGYTDRLTTLVAFIENNSLEMYRETWGYSGGGSDTANQEHASWMLFAHKLCFPQLGE